MKPSNVLEQAASGLERFHRLVLIQPLLNTRLFASWTTQRGVPAMSTHGQHRRLKGVEFVADEDGEKKAVLIDLRRYRDLWEDFYDTAVASARVHEPRESLSEVKRKVLGAL